MYIFISDANLLTFLTLDSISAMCRKECSEALEKPSWFISLWEIRARRDCILHSLLSVGRMEFRKCSTRTESKGCGLNSTSVCSRSGSKRFCAIYTWQSLTFPVWMGLLSCKVCWDKACACIHSWRRKVTETISWKNGQELTKYALE